MKSVAGMGRIVALMLAVTSLQLTHSMAVAATRENPFPRVQEVQSEIDSAFEFKGSMYEHDALALVLQALSPNFEANLPELPREGHNTYLVCHTTGAQVVIGYKEGICAAMNVHANGLLEFKPLTLRSKMFGLAVGTSKIGLVAKTQFYGIGRLDDLKGWYGSLESSMSAWIGGSMTWFQTDFSSAATLDGQFQAGVDGNALSAVATYLGAEAHWKTNTIRLSEDLIRRMAD